MTRFRAGLSAWVLGSLVLVAFGLVQVVRVPDMDHHVAGRIGGFGGKLDGSACYMNVSYTVDDKEFRIKPSPAKRWCGYGDMFDFRNQHIPVYYDPSAPEDGTLMPRGPWPGRLVVAGLVGLVVGLGTALRLGRQRSV